MVSDACLGGKMSKYHETEFYSSCPQDECLGEVVGTGWADQDGEIVKFIYQECKKCGWDQGS